MSIISILIASSFIAFINYLYKHVKSIFGNERKSNPPFESIELSTDEYELLGQYHFSEKSFDKALIYFNHSLSIQACHITFVFRGNTFLHLKQFDSAVHDYNQAIKISKLEADIYFNRGKAYYEIEKFELAKKDWVIASKLGNEQAGIFLNMFEDRSLKNSFYLSPENNQTKETYKWN
jgi:tetratricopeptide (TPR) repeat protein